jgi:hypothetical protein
LLSSDDGKHHVKVRVKYQYELSEDIQPEPGTAKPVISPEQFVKVKNRRLSRTFLFLLAGTAVCLTVAALKPVAEVQVTVGVVWAGLLEIARRQLAGRDHKKGKRKHG